MMYLLLRAFQTGLFDATVPIKGHAKKTGIYVQPYQAKRKKRLEDPSGDLFGEPVKPAPEPPKPVKLAPAISIAELAMQCASPQEFLEKIPNNSLEIVFHQTGHKQKKIIEKQGFRTGLETGLAERRGAIYAAGNTVNEGMYSRTKEGETFAGQKPAKIPIDLRGLRLWDATQYGFASDIGKRLTLGDLNVLPLGYDGAIKFLDNGEVYEVILTAASATKRMITAKKLDALWKELRPDLQPKPADIPLLTDQTTLEEAQKMGKAVAESLVPEFQRQFYDLKDKLHRAEMEWELVFNDEKRTKLQKEVISKQRTINKLRRAANKRTLEAGEYDRAEAELLEAHEREKDYEKQIDFSSKNLAVVHARNDVERFMEEFLQALRQRVRQRADLKKGGWVQSNEEFAHLVYDVDMKDPNASKLTNQDRNYHKQRDPKAMVKTIQEATEILGRPWNVKKITAHAKRGFYFNALKHVDIGWNDDSKNVLLHEMGHAIEYGFPQRNRLALEFRRSRAYSDNLVPIYPEIDDLNKDNPQYVSEVGYAGNYFNPYVGRVYPDNATEVLSMAAQNFTTGATLAAFVTQDIGHFYLFMACHPLARPGDLVNISEKTGAEKT